MSVLDAKAARAGAPLGCPLQTAWRGRRNCFADDKKLYEAKPSENYASIKKNVRKALDSVLQH